jgi:hypothetical protein
MKKLNAGSTFQSLVNILDTNTIRCTSVVHSVVEKA